MEYIWPSRRSRNQTTSQNLQGQMDNIITELSMNRSSLDSSRLLQNPRASFDSSGLAPWKKLGGSRSCTDLRAAAAESAKSSHQPHLLDPDAYSQDNSRAQRRNVREDSKDDAIEMKSRSSQKTFILVKISRWDYPDFTLHNTQPAYSLELLLSIMKAESFECRDARIRTHTLEIRNETWSVSVTCPPS